MKSLKEDRNIDLDARIDRKKIFYCTHMNRNNSFFQRHKLSLKIAPIATAHDIFDEMFGKEFIRLTVKNKLIQML